MSPYRFPCSSPLARRSSATCTGEAGFTLVELMVALSGGLFLSMVIFALARDTTRFYQREGRLASATLAGIVGFERLKADIERAGYLSTPNIQSDPMNCTPVDVGTPPGLQSLASLRISPDTPNLTGNGAFGLNASAGQVVAPDQIMLSGSYAATDEFQVRESSDGQTITLATNTGSMARLGYLNTSDATEQRALLQNVFGVEPGQILRYKSTKTGMLFFGQVAAVSGGPNPTVTLAAPFPLTSTTTGTCGIHGTGMGDSVNVVNLVRYRVMDLQNDAQGVAWEPLFTASQGATGEDTRTELVRDQLTPAGATIANTTDIVAEYAVDLEFAVMGQIATGNPTLALSDPTQANWTTFFATSGLGDRPQGVRSVRVRMSVRSREPDRSVKIPGGLFRFRVGSEEWARVRTFQADVALPNQRSVRW
jgi:Tfp pilus assembly protein PilW